VCLEWKIIVNNIDRIEVATVLFLLLLRSGGIRGFIRSVSGIVLGLARSFRIKELDIIGNHFDDADLLVIGFSSVFTLIEPALDSDKRTFAGELNDVLRPGSENEQFMNKVFLEPSGCL
jgi:hypothetical protein